MKTKKISLIAAMVLAAVCFLTISAWAAEYTCTVNEAGTDAYSGIVYITLTDDGLAFEDRVFRVRPGYENEHLAIALTAIASNLKVKVTTSGNPWAYLYYVGIAN